VDHGLVVSIETHPLHVIRRVREVARKSCTSGCIRYLRRRSSNRGNRMRVPSARTRPFESGANLWAHRSTSAAGRP
jgi:hypothetical protein